MLHKKEGCIVDDTLLEMGYSLGIMVLEFIFVFSLKIPWIASGRTEKNVGNCTAEETMV